MEENGLKHILCSHSICFKLCFFNYLSFFITASNIAMHNKENEANPDRWRIIEEQR